MDLNALQLLNGGLEKVSEFGLKCNNCLYWWDDDVDDTKYCHYFREDGYAPCEIDERESEEYDERR